MTVTKFDRANLRQIAADVDAALATVAAKHGITLKTGATRFEPGSSFTMKLEGRLANAVPTEAVDFVAFAGLFGLTPADYGRVLDLEGDRYAIVGIKPRAGKRPILLERVTDKRRVVIGEQYLRGLLATQPVVAR